MLVPANAINLGNGNRPAAATAAFEYVTATQHGIWLTRCTASPTAGKCDPYAVLTWESGLEYGKTETKKNTLEAEWNETFFLDVEDAAKGTSEDLVVTLFDWDAMSADDEIGTVRLSAHRISQLVKGSIGTTGEHTFTVMADGKPVVCPSLLLLGSAIEPLSSPHHAVV